MENPDIIAFKERIREEARLYHNTSISEKGFEHGRNEAIQWSYTCFLWYEKVLAERKINSVPDEEIIKFYEFINSSRSIRVITINRLKSDSHHVHSYKIIEEQSGYFPKYVTDDNKIEYCKAWFRGVNSVWQIVLKSMW